MTLPFGFLGAAQEHLRIQQTLNSKNPVDISNPPYEEILRMQ